MNQILKATLQGVYDRHVIEKVSPFLSTLVSSLLTTDPRRRPTADEILLRLTDERKQVGRSSEPKHVEPAQVEQDDDPDSDYGYGNSGPLAAEEDLTAKQTANEEALTVAKIANVEAEAALTSNAFKLSGAQKEEKKMDMSIYKYSELRDMINTSTDIEVLESCKEEFNRRRKVYHSWKDRHESNNPARAPASTLEEANKSGHVMMKKPMTTSEHRYFRLPFTRTDCSEHQRRRGFWYAHFNGQWIARQMELYPGRTPILLEAGKDDMHMCEMSLEETGLTREKRAEILESEFNEEWKKHGGQGYVPRVEPSDPRRRQNAEQLLRHNDEKNQVGSSKSFSVKNLVSKFEGHEKQEDDETFVESKDHQSTVSETSDSSSPPLPPPRSQTTAALGYPFPFILVSSSGPAADHQSNHLGLYRKTEEMREGRSVYIQEETKDTPTNKLSSIQGVWTITNYNVGLMRAATPSNSPTSTVKWQYIHEHDNLREYEITWHDDPALTVTGLTELPTCECEITISLSENVKRDIQEPGVVGEYRPLGSYRYGRPVLQHSEGRIRLYVEISSWVLGSYEQYHLGEKYLMSGSVPSQCPADPRAARNEKNGLTRWRYKRNQRGYTESKTITIKCNKHKHY